MTKIRATPTYFHGNNKGHTISETLKKTNYVFIRNDAHRTPLQRVYDGPYKVLKRTPKYFTLSKNGRDENISIDRLKAAFLANDFKMPPIVRRGRPPKTRTKLGGAM